MHVNLRARHSFAMHFATSAGSDYVAVKPIVELEQAKRATEMVTGVADRREARMRERGDWWMEGGMGVIDVGGAAMVHIGKTTPSPEPL
jgi:N-acyl-phosphatidylethanolamine-hydrolysing phospholipase D